MPNSSHQLNLVQIPGTFAVCRMSPNEPVPKWVLKLSGFYSITHSSEELSILCPEVHVPGNVKYEGEFTCLKVQGPLDFSMHGVLASLTCPLADAEISIFAVSTFDTDYLLLKQTDLKKAVCILEGAGHKITGNSL
ncbi:MAG: ACT domain-containing protein [Candidatus Saccharibacteria bacterium]